jgi:hypothetical protein
LAALLSRFVLTAALLTTLVAAALVLAALAGLRLVLVRLLLTTLIGIVCLIHALLLLLHINQTFSSNGMFPTRNYAAALVQLRQMTHLAWFNGHRWAFDMSNSIGTGCASGEDGINQEIFCSA